MEFLACLLWVVPLMVAGYVAVRNTYSVRRYRDWRCYSCGKGLVGSAPAGRCSECGSDYQVGAIMIWPEHAPMVWWRWLAMAVVPVIGVPLTFRPWIASHQGSDEFQYLVGAVGVLMPMGIMALACCRTVRPVALWAVAGLGVALPCLFVYGFQYRRDASIFSSDFLNFTFAGWTAGPLLAAVLGWVAMGECPSWWWTGLKSPPTLRPVGPTPPTEPGPIR